VEFGHTKKQFEINRKQHALHLRWCHYGTTYQGGIANYGIVFKIETDGAGFQVLRQFNSLDGIQPWAGLTICGTKLFGTTYLGGSSGKGVVFSLLLEPPVVLVTSPVTNRSRFAFSFNRVAEFTYSVLSAPDLSGPWSLVTNLTPAASGSIGFDTTIQAPIQRLFYRVRY
jgi:uncharacterized repeat protein (TIGR03803 family)